MHNANTEFQIAETGSLETDCHGQLLAPSAAWQEIRVLCSHTLPDTTKRPAHRCGSPALRGESFCFYHHPTRAFVRNPRERRAHRTTRKNFTIPAPTCHNDIHRSLSELVRRIAANQIDLKRANLLLTALQIVARDLPALPIHESLQPMRSPLPKGGSDWS
jgi:hypothetical protein